MSASRRPASTCGSSGPSMPAGVPELVHVDVHAGGRGHTHLDLRYLFDGGLAEGGSADPAPPDGESQEIGWFDWPAAIAIADDGLRGALISLTRPPSPRLTRKCPNRAPDERFGHFRVVTVARRNVPGIARLVNDSGIFRRRDGWQAGCE